MASPAGADGEADPNVSPAEPAATIANLRFTKPRPLIDTVMADAERLLEPADWLRLNNDVSLAETTDALDVRTV